VVRALLDSLIVFIGCRSGSDCTSHSATPVPAPGR